MIHDKLSDFIENYFLTNRESMGLISAGISNKTRDNKPTGGVSITFTVVSKSSKADVQIPESLKFNDVTYLTDVVERDIQYNEHAYCHNLASATVNKHRKLTRISDGRYMETRQPGMSVNNHTHSINEYTKSRSLTNALKIGTLGGFAVDNQDGKLIGMSNNHVFTPGFFSADLQADEHVNYANDSIVSPGDEQVIFNDAGTKIISNHGHMTKNKTTVIDGAEYRLGRVKRSIPHRFTGNEIDAAICSVEIDLAPNDNKRRIKQDTTSNAVDSYTPIGASFKHAINWATSDEIDNMVLGEDGVKLFKSSRTTGAVGAPGADNSAACELFCDSISFTSFVSGKGYKNLIQYKGKNGVDPSTGGDSGSWVYAFISDEWKVIGMHMAGGTDFRSGEDHALACRIDRIRELLDVSPWINPTRLPYAAKRDQEDQYCYKPNATYATIQGHSSEPVILIDGKKYYQTGRTVDKPTHIIDGVDGGVPVAKPRV